MGDAAKSVQLSELQRLHARVMQTIGVLASLVGLVTYLLFATLSEMRREAHVMQDSLLKSVQEAKDSGTVQRARLWYRMDSLATDKRRRPTVR